MKIVIILVFAAILLALCVLFIYLIASIVKGRAASSAEAKNREIQLKKNPAAWRFWENLAAWLSQTAPYKKPQHAHNEAQWEDFHKRYDKISALIIRVQKYIESHPNDVFRIQDMEHILPVMAEFFRGYNACLSFGADTTGGQEYIRFVQDGLENAEKIMNGYIDMLFKNKGSDIRAEIDVMLKWYGENKSQLDGYGREN